MTTYRPIDLAALGDLLVAVGSPHQYLVQDLVVEGKPVAEVHHYTDLNALAGIVEKDDLWLTNSTYSNDYDELEHGFKVAKRVLTEEAEAARGPDKRYLNTVRNGLEEARKQGVFVACFCLEANLLSQWRTYGADGAGVSVGFEPSGFRYIAGPDAAPYGLPTEIGLLYLWRVFYEIEQQENIVRECLRIVMAQDVPYQRRVERTIDALRFFAPTFKNDRFREEREARLVFSPNPECNVKPHYRVARGMLVPYYSLQDLAQEVIGARWKLPITSVQVGPGPNRTLNARAAASLLDQHDYPPSVTVSATPYRA